MAFLPSCPSIYLKVGSCPVCITSGRTSEITPLPAVKRFAFYAVSVSLKDGGFVFSPELLTYIYIFIYIHLHVCAAHICTFSGQLLWMLEDDASLILINVGAGQPGWLSILTRLRVGRPGVDSWYCATMHRPTVGPTQLPGQWDPDVLSRRIKRLGREADISPLCNAEVKNAWSFPHTLRRSWRRGAQGQLYFYC